MLASSMAAVVRSLARGTPFVAISDKINPNKGVYMAENEELLDLVNQKDEIIGTIWRAEYDRLETEDLGYIRAVEMFIVNDKNELWIPKRTAHKKIAPNGLDFSVGGHVSSGETYMEAMLKEIREELNMNLTEDDIEFIQTIGPDINRYIRKLYIHRSNQTPQYNPDDFVSASWLSPDTILEMLDAGVPAKMSLRDTVALVAGRLATEQ